MACAKEEGTSVMPKVKAKTLAEMTPDRIRGRRTWRKACQRLAPREVTSSIRVSA